ncbi:uncharacterized protein Gasu_53730 [Galdieria sulphuraria]|uniref:RWD domain-containing protein n=1 Tax=Galdieria sulphuraria TaxID=130081 RepID=M2XAW7_GALSU|nr:uncharacterized protein Gasu_53730 [Galdieria sulphuraria]EME27037.1 hypothetical protein Gasu_53730 [Galdieria sulphuraria]|eukprot:XP_005703557.1 hypothetical protein Gasu_53730 [Galdieria sulphuraria]
MHVNDAQREEIEALEAILGDDFSLQQDETTRRPLIKLDFSEERPKVQFSLYLCLPPSYPEDSPSMTIQPGKGFPGTWRSPLLQFLKNEMNLLMGAPMIFELYMKTKDWLLEQEKEDEAEDIDRVSCVGSVPSVNENTKLESSLLIHSLIEEKEYGTPVTKETFEKWRQSFFQEFGLSLRNKERETAWKLTGRQLFEENRLVETSETYGSSEDEE